MNCEYLTKKCAIAKVTVSQGHRASDLVIEGRNHLRQLSAEPLESVCSLMQRTASAATIAARPHSSSQPSSSNGVIGKWSYLGV